MSRLSTYMALPTLRGSNANGEWIKFSDGTLICTHRYKPTPFVTIAPGLGVSLGGWTFPALFVGAPVVTLNLEGAYSSVLIVSADGVDTTNAYPIYASGTSSGTSFSGDLSTVAIGRWF